MPHRPHKLNAKSGNLGKHPPSTALARMKLGPDGERLFTSDGVVWFQDQSCNRPLSFGGSKGPDRPCDPCYRDRFVPGLEGGERATHVVSVDRVNTTSKVLAGLKALEKDGGAGD